MIYCRNLIPVIDWYFSANLTVDTRNIETRWGINIDTSSAFNWRGRLLKQSVRVAFSISGNQTYKNMPKYTTIQGLELVRWTLHNSHNQIRRHARFNHRPHRRRHHHHHLLPIHKSKPTYVREIHINETIWLVMEGK